MKFFQTNIAVLALSLSFGIAVFAQNDSLTLEALPPAPDLLAPQNLAAWQIKAGEKTAIVPVTGQSFSSALRITTVAKSAGEQVSQPIGSAFRTGDAGLWVFWARAVATRDETGEASGEAILRKEGAWQKARIPFGASREWKRITLPFQAEADFGAGYRAILSLRGAHQTLEIAEVSLLNFGTKVAARQLPMSSRSYPGRELEAPWRAAAWERIEKHRKSELKIRVVDGAGKAVAGAQVGIELKKHAFLFGTAVGLEDFYGLQANGKKFYAYGGAKPKPDDTRRMRELIPQLFNTVTLGDLKWAQGNGDQYHDLIGPLIRELRTQNMSVRGHVMVWPGWENLPKSLRKLESDKPALALAIENRIDDLGRRYGGQIEEWDVANEVQWNSDLQRILGPQVLGEWFVRAKRNDAKSKLFLNEAFGLTWTAMHDEIVRITRELKKQGAPVEGIGIEAHHGFGGTSPDVIFKTLDRLGRETPYLSITEYDMSSPDEALQADYLRDLLTVAFSHPQMTSFILWGFWDGSHWKGNAPLFRRDWTPKPALAVWRDLTRKQWWTSVQSQTDARGEVSMRGFLGEYELTVRRDEVERVVKTTLANKGAAIVVTLPPEAQLKKP